jgi:hypothetical protein
MLFSFEGGFPMLAIEGHRINSGKIDIVYAAYVDIDHVGIGSRYVKRMNAAGAAKRMLGHVSVEGISGQMIATVEYLELVCRDNHVQQTLHRAHRAIADGDARKIASHAKTYAAAMTPAFVCMNHESPQLVDNSAVSE